MKATARTRRAKSGPKLGLSLLCLLGLLILQPALAKQDDRNQPMNFASKTVDGFNQPNTITTLTGNVVATQGTMKVTGDVHVIDGNQTRLTDRELTANHFADLAFQEFADTLESKRRHTTKSKTFKFQRAARSGSPGAEAAHSF